MRAATPAVSAADMSEEASGSYPPSGAATIRPAAGLAVMPLEAVGSGVVPEPGAVSVTYERVLVNGASWPFREVAPTAMTPG